MLTCAIICLSSLLSLSTFTSSLLSHPLVLIFPFFLHMRNNLSCSAVFELIFMPFDFTSRR